MHRRVFKDRLWDAYDGVRSAVQTQRNMQIHLMAAAVVLIAGALLRVGTVRLLFLVLAIALVFITEIINTAVETLVNLVTDKVHPLARAAKHLAAGAVLTAALFAAVIGVLVFYGPLVKLVR